MDKLRIGSFSEGGYIILTTKKEPHKIVANVIKSDGIDLVEIANRIVDSWNACDGINPDAVQGLLNCLKASVEMFTSFEDTVRKMMEVPEFIVDQHKLIISHIKDVISLAEGGE